MSDFKPDLSSKNLGNEFTWPRFVLAELHRNVLDFYTWNIHLSQEDLLSKLENSALQIFRILFRFWSKLESSISLEEFIKICIYSKTFSNILESNFDESKHELSQIKHNVAELKEIVKTLYGEDFKNGFSNLTIGIFKVIDLIVSIYMSSNEEDKFVEDFLFREAVLSTLMNFNYLIQLIEDEDSYDFHRELSIIINDYVKDYLTGKIPTIREFILLLLSINIRFNDPTVRDLIDSLSAIDKSTDKVGLISKSFEKYFYSKSQIEKRVLLKRIVGIKNPDINTVRDYFNLHLQPDQQESKKEYSTEYLCSFFQLYYNTRYQERIFQSKLLNQFLENANIDKVLIESFKILFESISPSSKTINFKSKLLSIEKFLVNINTESSVQISNQYLYIISSFIIYYLDNLIYRIDNSGNEISVEVFKSVNKIILKVLVSLSYIDSDDFKLNIFASILNFLGSNMISPYLDETLFYVLEFLKQHTNYSDQLRKLLSNDAKQNPYIYQYLGLPRFSELTLKDLEDLYADDSDSPDANDDDLFF